MIIGETGAQVGRYGAGCHHDSFPRLWEKTHFGVREGCIPFKSRKSCKIVTRISELSMKSHNYASLETDELNGRDARQYWVGIEEHMYTY